MGQPPRQLRFDVDGRSVVVDDDGDTLLGVLRDRLRLTGAVKDGCSPQGQCGCCTVLVDGQPRVACVTPARRVQGRRITTVEGFEPAVRQRWAEAFVATGGSQCGFCTPGIICRLEGLRAGRDRLERSEVERALLAHLCRCTGWQTITEAALAVGPVRPGPGDAAAEWPAVRVVGEPDDHGEPGDHGQGPEAVEGDDRTVTAPSAVAGGRDPAAASARATLEGGAEQQVGPAVALGGGGFSADTAPRGCLIAVPDQAGGWAVGETVAEARRVAGKVQGRRTTEPHGWPLELPPGTWDATLRTTWVEPAYLEPDAAWCEPGGEPTSPLANGGAFGGKATSPLPAVARTLADQHSRPVLALFSREDTVRHGPKRPPVAGGARADGTGVLRVVHTDGIAEAVAAVAPGLRVEPVAVPGPPTGAHLRAAGWAEAVVLLAGARGQSAPVVDPRSGGRAEAWVDDEGAINVRVSAGDPLDEVVLRSYCIGAAHMAWSWLTSEALAVDGQGEVLDLTVRSFGILRAVDTPPIHVELDDAGGAPVRGSDAVFAAVAAAGWLAAGRPTDWPIGTRP